jgi:hypothetical protein
MLLGKGLEVDPALPVSSGLINNLQSLQEIHHCWNPIFKKIQIDARRSPSVSLNPGVMAFFSGGVDSTYTFLKRSEEITHLVFIQGFNFFVKTAPSRKFSTDDVCDSAQLAFRLTTAGGAASAFFRDSLSRNALDGLLAYRSTGVVPPGLEARVSEDLNAVLSGPLIWERDRFAGVRLRPETRDLLEKRPKGEDIHCLNRLLLEDLYPLAIARRKGEDY